MKILNEEQQLKKRKDELYNLWQFAEHEVEVYREKIDKKEDRWFSNKGLIRIMKYYKNQYKQVSEAISEYYSEVSERYDAIQKQIKERENINSKSI